MNPTATLAIGRKPIQLSLGSLTLRPGIGMHRMDLQVETQASWLVEAKNDANSLAHVLMQGHLEVPPSRPVAALMSQVIQVRGWWVTESLTAMLSDDQLLALDNARNGTHLRLQFDLSGMFLDDGIERIWSKVQFQYTATEGEWIRLLDQAGLGVAINVRVPTPLVDVGAVDADVPESSSFRQAGLRLRQARQALLEGREEDCVQACRKVLEAIEHLCPMPSQAEVAKTPAGKRDEAARWAALHQSLNGLASAAHHDDPVTKDFIWSRPDADAVLAATAGLLARAARQR